MSERHKQFWVLALTTLTLGLVSACTSLPRSAPPAVIQGLKSIEVIVGAPKSNFQYPQDRTTFVPMVGPNVALGPAVAIAITANFLVNSLEYAAAATAREAAEPVGRTVDDIDLARTALAQLHALKPASSTVRLSLAPDGLPPADSRDMVQPSSTNLPDPQEAAYARRARLSSADATLFLALLPQFMPDGGQAGMRATMWLFDRTGQRLSLANYVFIGPYAPRLPRPELISWWADHRYRAVVLQGLRGVLLPVADDLWNAKRVEVEWMAMQQKLTTGMRIDGLTGASQDCAFERTAGATSYRFARERFLLRIWAFCEGDPKSAPPEGSPPEFSWVTTLPGPPAAAVVRAPASAASAP